MIPGLEVSFHGTVSRQTYPWRDGVFETGCFVRRMTAKDNAPTKQFFYKDIYFAGGVSGARYGSEVRDVAEKLAEGSG